MKDKGLVISTKNDLAQVEVQCLIESCGSCSAKSLCTGKDKDKGIIAVKNPLNACAGDRVEIKIPETEYNRVLILIFGSLLVAALLGMGTGYLLSFFLPLSSSASSFLGLLLAVICAGGILYHHFRRNLKHQLYPVIINIIKKGDCHG